MVTKNEYYESGCIATQEETEECLKKYEQTIYAEKQREKMEALGQLAGGIAHDFNNQLMSIIGNATMIQKTEDIEKIKEYAERIIHISQSAAKLTKKILLFSKKGSSINESIDLKCVLDNTYNMVESIVDKTIDFTYSYNANNKMIMGNDVQIENMIVNLIINARDALDGNVGNIKIYTEDSVIYSDVDLTHGETIKPGQYIKVCIEDNGIGIDEETFNKLFEPYFTTKNKAKGTGLGLSVVFGTVKSHSGYINVKSELSCGTVFEIYLPVIEDIKQISSNQKEITNNLIMLVDDDLNVLEIEGELLEDLGYDVEKFNNPINALEYYRKEHNKIAFVVLDIIMPDMNGNELYEELQKIDKEAVAIFISGFSGQAEYEELIKKGYIVVEKPFTFTELSTQIAKLYL